MGSQRRVEPGTENKMKLGVPGPTAYNVPSKVNKPLINLLDRLLRDLEFHSVQK